VFFNVATDRFIAYIILETTIILMQDKNRTKLDRGCCKRNYMHNDLP